MSDAPHDSRSSETLPPRSESQMEKLLRHVSPEQIPASEDLYAPAELKAHLDALREPPLSLVAVGDIMLGGRARETLAREGARHAFRAVRPLLRQAFIVLGNLEGPLAREAKKEDRNYSYKVKPKLAHGLSRAGLNVVTLANNHLLDCGRAGVVETLDALKSARIASIGAGVDEPAAHVPAILEAGRFRVGLLGYYWNLRCAATASLPGAAVGTRDALKTDVSSLREKVDRVVVTFHWGVPYEREPTPEARATAHFAVECGADVVLGHHPHIVQPFEVHDGRPIFYSLGNFAFGSNNSRAEGLLVGIRFEESETLAHAYPLYVKNRDPRVNHQPKVMRGASAERVLRRLAEISQPMGGRMELSGGRGTLRLPRVAPKAPVDRMSVKPQATGG